MDLLDIRWNIYLHASIESIYHLCVDQMSLKIFHNKEFWRKKFVQDNLCLFTYGLSIAEWIKEYQKVKKVQEKAKIIAISTFINKSMYKNIEKDNEFNMIKIKSVQILKSIMPNIAINGFSIDAIKVILCDNQHQLYYDELIIKISYNKLWLLLINALYNDIEITNNEDYDLFYSEDAATTTEIVGDVLKYLNEYNELFKLQKSKAKIIMLIQGMEKNKLYIKSGNKSTLTLFPNLMYTLLPAAISDLIINRINAINPVFSKININIFIINKFIICDIKVYINDLNYKIKIKYFANDNVIYHLINNALLQKLNIVDGDNEPFYCDYKCISPFYAHENDTLRRRTVMRQTLELLYY